MASPVSTPTSQIIDEEQAAASNPTDYSSPFDITPGAGVTSTLSAASQQSAPGHCTWDCAPGLDFGALLQHSFEIEPDDTSTPPPEGALGLDPEPLPALTPSPVVDCSHAVPSLAPNEGHRVSQSRHNIQRRFKRAAEKATQGHIPRARTHQKYVASAKPVFTDVDSTQLRSQVGAYGAVSAKFTAGDRTSWDLEMLRAEGIEVVPWEGRDPRAFVDAAGRVLVVLAGQPRGASYQQAVVNTYELMDGMRGALPLTDHRRGLFSVLNVGLLHQQGTKRPVYMNHGHPELVDTLLNDPNVRQLASFASASFQLWGQKVYNHCKDRLDRLYDHLNLTPNFERSIYPAAAFNFGPNAWTYRHRDVLNLPYGWCAVQALGKFNHTKGGHIVLWELGVAVEFPPGACILLPSATITHSNIPVQAGETRASFTQYVPGGLLRYVDYGMRLQSEFSAQDPAGYALMCETKASRWKEGLDLLSQWDDVVKQWGV